MFYAPWIFAMLARRQLLKLRDDERSGRGRVKFSMHVNQATFCGRRAFAERHHLSRAADSTGRNSNRANVINEKLHRRSHSRGRQKRLNLKPDSRLEPTSKYTVVQLAT